MKRIVAAIAPAALLLASAPAAAQGEASDEDFAALGALMQSMYEAEPLTAEQEARLPQAGALVDKILPEGAYARMMQDMFGQMLDPIASMMPEAMPPAAMALALGLPSETIETLGEAKQAEIADLIDPVFSRRSEVMMEYMLGEMGGMVAQFEPGMRRGLSRAYAKRFTLEEMADIQAFFATPTGARYATESMLVFTDPQTMAGTMEAMPAMLEQMPQMMGGIEEAMAVLPPQRGFADLSEAERSRLAALLDFTVPELKVSMEAAEAEKGELADE